MVRKKKKLSKKINEFVKKTYYGRSPQDAGYLKSQDDIGSLEDIYNPMERELLHLLNTNLPDHLRSYITFVEDKRGRRPYVDFTIVDKKTGKKYNLDIKSSAKESRQIREAFEKTFGTFEKGLDALKKYEPDDEISKIMGNIRDNSEPLSSVIEKFKNKIAVTNPTTGTVRKQKFIKDKITPLVPDVLGRDTDKSFEYFKDFFEQEQGEKAKKDFVGFYKRLKAIKTKPNVVDVYIEKHGLKNIFDIIKSHGKHKKLVEVKTWADLHILGSGLNFTPQELFDYAMEKAQTKKKFLELAFYREIDKNRNQAFYEFIPVYKNHLKTKTPLKVFMFTDEYKLWSAKWNIYFKSEENLRQNIKIMIKIWNKQFPKDKIPEKLK